MKAIVQTAYGSSDVLRLKEVDAPAVKEGEVLVENHASSVNAGDLFGVLGSPWLVKFTLGWPKPKDYIMGWDIAGRVKQVGAGVTRYKPGDEVYGSSNHTFAEYVVAKEDQLAPKPGNLSFEQAAAVPSAGITALQAVRDQGKVRKGQKVLVTGASGGVGSWCVQIAKALGAEVTGVCSTGKVDMVRSLGADHVIDYSKEDFTRTGKRYDAIIDNVPRHKFKDLKRAVAPDGIIAPNSGHGGMSYVTKAFMMAPFDRRIAKPFMAKINNKDLMFLKDLLESKKIAPVIDRTFPLSRTSEALDHLERRLTKGKVVITIK